VDAGDWSVTVDGEVAWPRSWSLAELQRTFEPVEVMAVLECAGNGRSGFAPETDGLQWTDGAVGCARWGGVRMRDVLMACGLKESAVYTGHLSPDMQAKNAGKPALSRGLPIAKALAPETLIAFSMNGAPLPLLHGAPVRLVAPGFPGSAWQKWLNRIWVRDREHDGEKMTGTNYRLPRQPVTPGEKADPAMFDVIVDMPVKSLITHPPAGAVFGAGEGLEIRGFAWSGHVPVAGVFVSADGGQSWRDAALDPAAERFAWRRFRATWPGLAPGPATFVARATDAEGRSQPLGSAPWNPRGYCNNAAHRVGVVIQSA
jgi:DMSO/TMAO reductase YedYZ molybdopterin-dependent catalytic subunit